VLLGECQYPEISSFVFDKDNSSASYRKEIAHMARYYRLHLGSFLAMEFAKELSMYRQRYNGNNNNNRFESVIELYEAGCADYIFNFIIDCIPATPFFIALISLLISVLVAPTASLDQLIGRLGCFVSF
jgi:hypothetical protein